MRIRVSDVLDLFAAGLSAGEILEEMPDREADDLKASLLYASRKLNFKESLGCVGRMRGWEFWRLSAIAC